MWTRVDKYILSYLNVFIASVLCTSCVTTTLAKEAIRLPEILSHDSGQPVEVSGYTEVLEIGSNSGLVEELAARINKGPLKPNHKWDTIKIRAKQNQESRIDEKGVQPAEKSSRKKSKATVCYSIDVSVRFWRQDESIPSAASLAQDALQIFLTTGSEQHTVLCVALFNNALKEVDQEPIEGGYVERFAFHNQRSKMSKAARNCAEKLGYALIQAGQSHAEVQFLQFLRDRLLGKYTHLVAMGCSRLHCPECDTLLSCLLSKDYKKVTACASHTLNQEIVTTLEYGDKYRTVKTILQYEPPNRGKRERKLLESKTDMVADTAYGEKLPDSLALQDSSLRRNMIEHGDCSTKETKTNNFYLPYNYLSYLCARASLLKIRISKKAERYINEEDKSNFQNPKREDYEQSGDWYVINR